MKEIKIKRLKLFLGYSINLLGTNTPISSYEPKLSIRFTFYKDDNDFDERICLVFTIIFIYFGFVINKKCLA